MQVLNILQSNGYKPLTSSLDILVIAILIYSLFLFIKKTRSHMVLVGMGIALLLYAAAKAFNLELTLLTLQYFAGAFVVVSAVVFQTEIRRYFELLGLLGTRQIKVGLLTAKSPTITEVVHACVKMAQERTGALIVMQGKDDVDTVIDGGVDLDGVISEEILLSIFDATSEGHDGALIINNNRISKFGTHLPLSTNFKEIGKHGTRHSAALGATEHIDALCIVISEEKGTISVCRDGKMKTLANFSDIEKELDKFIKAKFTQPKPENTFAHLLTHNTRLKVISIVIASVVWFLTLR